MKRCVSPSAVAAAGTLLLFAALVGVTIRGVSEDRANLEPAAALPGPGGWGADPGGMSGRTRASASLRPVAGDALAWRRTDRVAAGAWPGLPPLPPDSPASARPTEESPSSGGPSASAAEPQQAQERLPAALSEAQVRFDPEFRLQVAEALSGAGSGHLAFPLTDGRVCDLVITRHEAGEGGEGVVYAHVANQPSTHAVLAYASEAVAGTIMAGNDGLFQVRYSGDGTHRVTQLDPALLPDSLPPVRPPGAAEPSGRAQGRPLAASAPQFGWQTPRLRLDADDPSEPVAPWEPPVLGEAPVAVADIPRVQPRDGTDTILDLMVVYTPQARAANGGTSGMTALVNASVATANLTFSQGQAGLRLRIAYSGEVAYTSSGSLSTDLGRLQGTSDGFMDGIHALRDQHKADLVSLIVPRSSDGYAGVGYLLVPASMSGYLDRYAFTTVVDVYADSNLTLAHEIGHNLGGGHAADDPSPTGAYSYSRGYRFSAGGTTYRTLMAYAPGVRIPYLSNPALTYLGAALGTAGADNARTLREDKGAIAACRTGFTDWGIAAADDLNGDGKPDLIGRNLLGGRVITWLMNGHRVVSSAGLWSATNVGDSAWVVVATGDFNADGQADLVWRNSTTGGVVVWLMNGVTRVSTVVLYASDPVWMPVAAGDLNGDGKADMVWRNSTTGGVVAWLMNGVTRTAMATIYASDPAWVPMIAADLTGNGHTDILWRNSTTGAVIVWLMNRLTRTGITSLYAGDAFWVPVAAQDFNADGRVDVVWRHSITGQVLIWNMNGLTRTGTTVVWGG